MKRFGLVFALLLIAAHAHAGLVSAVIEVPESTMLDTSWCTANPGPCYETFRLDLERTVPIAPDTKAVAGKKLSLVTLDIDGTDPLALVEGLFIIYNMPWSVVCMQSFHADEPILVDGIEAGRQAISYKPCDTAKLYPYQQTRHTYDADGNITGDLPKQLDFTAQWAGQAPWR